VIAAYLTTALVVGGVGAWHLLRARRAGEPATEGVRVMFSMAMWMAALVAPGADLRRRSARPQHARASARQGDGDGGHYEDYPTGAR
jgi:cytochrome d ubiquinol oxidase subunit I